ncbi:MAG: dienelactone hydrolase family protein [Anaerolineae bacterium]|nr:dienelactone hydrolase family protein [Anaerolineae bacterium]
MGLTQHQYAYGGARIGYLLFTPGSSEDTRRKQPLILFLHGAGERGSDPELLKRAGLPKIVADDPDSFPYMMLAPQCPDNEWWVYDEQLLLALLDHVILHYLADARRIYLTGCSMGGYGAWMLGAAHPQRFAAIAPVSAPALHRPEDVCALKDTPVWAFHGLADFTVPAQQTEVMIGALCDCGGKPEVTYVEGAGHELTTSAYADQRLFAWMRKQVLSG